MIGVRRKSVHASHRLARSAAPIEIYSFGGRREYDCARAHALAHDPCRLLEKHSLFFKPPERTYHARVRAGRMLVSHQKIKTVAHRALSNRPAHDRAADSIPCPAFSRRCRTQRPNSANSAHEQNHTKTHEPHAKRATRLEAPVALAGPHVKCSSGGLEKQGRFSSSLQGSMSGA